MLSSAGNRNKAVGLAAAMVAALIAAFPSAGAMPLSAQAPGAPANVIDFEPPTRMERYRVTDLGGTASPRDDKTWKARFRVAERTGNCCETFVTISPKGQLLDLGGSYVNFTNDNGKTWKQVQPPYPLVNGEGAIAVAPNGDVVGIEWDPYSGDHLLSYKYDAAAEEWQYLEAPLHTPFYDRPWLTVVPGPFSINGAEVPYVTFVDGFPHRGPFLYSTDGLTYIQTSNPFLDEEFEPAYEGWLNTAPDPSLDWVAPNTRSPIIPLGGGSALAEPGPFVDAYTVFDSETRRWRELVLPDGAEPLQGRLLVDSRGRIHNLVVKGQLLEYRISADRAKTWRSVVIDLPGEATGNEDMVNIRVNAGIGVAAVALRATNRGGDLDLVYKVDITSNTPRLSRLYEIGLGDIEAAAGVGQDIRFDFESVALFPDGRIAVSFLDSTTGPVKHLLEPIKDRLGPALAIEL